MKKKLEDVKKKEKKEKTAINKRLKEDEKAIKKLLKEKKKKEKEEAKQNKQNEKKEKLFQLQRTYDLKKSNFIEQTFLLTLGILNYRKWKRYC